VADQMLSAVYHFTNLIHNNKYEGIEGLIFIMH